MNKEIELYFSKHLEWKEELSLLRELVLDCGLTEEYKWRNPCYTHRGKNIVLLGVGKESCVISFFKGTLLSDNERMLQNIGEHTKSAKLISFKSSAEINKVAEDLKSYVKEAVKVEIDGLKVDYEKEKELVFPIELTEKFKEEPELKVSFLDLTRGRQKGYVLYISSAKQASTRTARIEKYKERILNGKGMLDCVCGLSKRMPSCDGSHKYA